MAMDFDFRDGTNEEGQLVTLAGMYREYFLDYASYVILERAVPHLDDGFKPVQRRILHALKEMDDGRYNKVANVIGQTMQYHPHGDASIGDAMVNLGQKDLLIDCQGNWGDLRTGDGAAAPRYIEARLTKFALEVVFNPQTTDWQMSYDGRKREPITLPVKFPMILAQGVEGIAVGLATKILPHNFVELIKESIKILQGKKPVIYPDFQTGGYVDVSDYNDGLRGGKIKARAKIKVVDKTFVAVYEIPFGVTTTSMIDSIIKAADKGQIKIKKVLDNTAKDVEILIELSPGISPDLTIDALYAFTDCEVSISPNACVIVDNKPRFIGVSEMLITSTMRTKELLRLELEIKAAELAEKWHMASLEKIFIEKRIYRDIEECETWEDVITTIDIGLKKYVATPSDPLKAGDGRIAMRRDITEDDIVRLTEIKIKRISKFNSFKADELILSLQEEMDQVDFDLANLIDYSIAYFTRLLEKYGKGRERKTEITSMESIQVQQVVANNAKLYINRADGFVGMGLKKDEFVCDCSDLDDVIAFTKDGTFKVVRIADKVFIGKDIIHVEIWRKSDDRTTYNMIYLDGRSGTSYAKRFNVTSITRDKEYDATKGEKGSKVIYFTTNPNGESERVNIQLSPNSAARLKVFEFDFEDLSIKGRSSQGNIVTKYPVRKVVQIAVGKSSLGAIKAWVDEVSGRLNADGRGKYLGEFDTGTKIIALYNDGSYELSELDFNKKYDMSSVLSITRHLSESVVSAIYFEGEKGWTMIKRFRIETSSLDTKYRFISEAITSKLYFASLQSSPEVLCEYKNGKIKEEKEVKLAEFIDVKGWKALGNKFLEGKLTNVKLLNEEDINALIAGESVEVKEPKSSNVIISNETAIVLSSDPIKGSISNQPIIQVDLFGNPVEPKIKSNDSKTSEGNDKLKPGDSIDLDV
jgi:topoisomerase-4 subunit A